MAKRSEFSAWFKKNVGLLPMPTNLRLKWVDEMMALRGKLRRIEGLLAEDDFLQQREYGARSVWNALKTKGGK